MTDMMEEYDFTGSYGAEVAKESNKGGDFQREIEYLTLKADPTSIQQGKDTAIVRLVTEYERKPHFDGFPTTRWSLPWITVKQHYAPTKQRPPYAREGSQWPEKMFVGCRKDKVFAKKFNNQCHICDVVGSKPSDRTYALGIEREQVIENGKITGTRDKMREVLDLGPDGKPIVEKEEGDRKIYKKKWVPAWVVLNFGWKNFFNALSGQASYHQTALGRDYVIKRTGTGNNDTNYAFIPLDPITMTGEWAQAIGVAEGTPYDLGLIIMKEEGTGRPIPLSEVLYPDMPDLRKIIADRVTDDYFGRWFVPGWLPEGFDPSTARGTGAQSGVQNGVQSGYTGNYTPQGGQGQQAQPQQPQQPVTPDQPASSAPQADALAALRARVTGAQQAPQQ